VETVGNRQRRKREKEKAEIVRGEVGRGGEEIDLDDPPPPLQSNKK